ncbi:MAG: GspH/FimT family protein [Burkholderiales bacterium]|nr:GspH/FimT family protein [Burkholderiales bacterium]
MAVTLVVMAALVAAAMPFMSEFIGSRTAESYAEEMVSTLRQARSEAMKRRLEVTVCAGQDLSDANASCSGTATWSEGWISFVDFNNDGDRDADEPLLRVFSGPIGLKTSVASAHSLTLARTGILLRADGAALDGDDPSSVRFEPSKGSDRAARTVCVNRQGRVALLKGAGACE